MISTVLYGIIGWGIIALLVVALVRYVVGAMREPDFPYGPGSGPGPHADGRVHAAYRRKRQRERARALTAQRRVEQDSAGSD